MAISLKATLQDLGRGKPGHRFQDRYRRSQRSKAARGWMPRILRFAGAAVAIAIGLVLAFIPGPAVLFFLLAGALLASDSLWIARALDWIEVRARRVGRWAQRLWRRLPTYGRAALLIAGGCLSVASTYGFYRLVN
jgi:hypothetical protein